MTLEQHRGEILAVIGPNGAGKTSLFNCLTGVYTPQEGSIDFNALDKEPINIVGRAPHKVTQLGVARTFQTSRMFNALTTFENIKIGVEANQKTGPIGAMLRLPRTRREEHESDERTLELLDLVGLTHRLNTTADSLPYGDRRRLEIARALGDRARSLAARRARGRHQPVREARAREVDPQDQRRARCLDPADRARHALVMSLAERIYVLNFGQLIATGTPGEIQQNPEVIDRLPRHFRAEGARQ